MPQGGYCAGALLQLEQGFLEAGKKRLAGDTARAATSDEVRSMRGQTQALKEAVADLTLENRLLKKSMIGDGDYQHLGGVLIAHLQLRTRHRRTKRNIPVTGSSPFASIQYQNCPICKWLDLSMCRQAQRVWLFFSCAQEKAPQACDLRGWRKSQGRSNESKN